MARKKKEKTKEEQEQYLLENSFSDCMSDIEHNHIPEPTYVFKFGDRVQYGRWEYAEVLEVLEGGKLYKIFQKTPNIRYGKYEGDKKEIRYHTWIELLPYCDNTDVEKFTQDEDVQFSFSQRQISSLLHTSYSTFGIDLEADYQRGNVWSEEQKVALIDLIFRNIDIGKFTLIRRSFKTKQDFLYEILDGKQRLTAIREFFEGRFKYKGKTFQELHPFDQNHFEDYDISYASTEPLTDEQKYRYFLKLNVSGVPMDENHLKKVEKMLKKEEKKVSNP